MAVVKRKITIEIEEVDDGFIVTDVDNNRSFTTQYDGDLGNDIQREVIDRIYRSK